MQHIDKMAVESKSTLLVKHLPSSLSAEDKTDLLKHFGATMVRCMGTKGKMKNCAFATFLDHQSARLGLKRLHQLDVLSCTLSAEFSKQPKYHKHVADNAPDFKDAADGKVNDKEQSEVHSDPVENNMEEKLSQKLNSLCSNWGFNYPLNPKLHYLYPPPNPVILANVANALAAVPRFYYQVLHLMNKMNLPAPFGSPTAVPPLAEFVQQNFESAHGPPLPPDEAYLPEPPEEPRSSEESEMESEGDEPKIANKEIVPVIPKKRRSNLTGPSAKKMKMLHVVKPTVRSGQPKNVITAEDMFEQVQGSQPKKIEFKLPMALTDGLNEEADITSNIVPPSVSEEDTCNPDDHAQSHVVGGFGQMVPQNDMLANSDGEMSPEENWGEAEFISSSKLKKGRLSKSEIRELSVFRNYQPGDKSSRLYLKNLSKQVTEKDLHYVYGRYVSWEDNLEKLMFDIRLMKEGRMKGQAFITLPSDDAAKSALEDTNGFVLHDKPIVVQFARSAKAKDKSS